MESGLRSKVAPDVRHWQKHFGESAEWVLKHAAASWVDFMRLFTTQIGGTERPLRGHMI